MAEQQGTAIETGTFQQAVFRSERLRLVGLLVVLAAGLAMVLLRAAVAADPAERHLALVWTCILAGAAVFEIVVYVAVGRAIASGVARAPLPMTIGPLVETLVPTLGLAALAGAPGAGPLRALGGPAVVIYYLLIMLSILRLSPALSLLAGALSAVGYAVVWQMDLAQFFAGRPQGMLATGMFATQTVLLVLAGGIAAAVAVRVRGHVEAALREAAARREVERYQGELQLACGIQQGLLPAAAPAIAGFEVAGWNRPADETGGDYYDFVDVAGGQWIMVVADVTGHGIAAALVMAACRAYLRACLSTTPALGEAFTITSGRLLGDLPRGKFVTLAALRCGPGSPETELLSAGHGPILLYRDAEKAVSEIKANGIPLGMLPGFPYAKSAALRLAAGDMVVILTDGFWEWENGAGEQFGLDRLKPALVASAGRPAAEVIANLAAAVEVFAAGARQSDDLTAVVVRKL
jgi:serine phosphatase RsbU (regulator of sigma subunit)